MEKFRKKHFAICLFGILTALPIERNCFAANKAAEYLAAKLYRQAGIQINSLQWQRALSNLELVALLNPSFKEAASKRQKLSEDLDAAAQREYWEGMKAFRLLQFNDALFHWRQARGYLMNPEDPLVLKIENAKRFVTVGLLPISPVNREQTPIPQKMKQVQDFLKEGKKNEALISLKEVLRDDPSDVRAQTLLAQLQETKSPDPDLQKEAEKTREKFLKAEELFREGGEAIQQKNPLEAYQNLREAMKQFESTDIRAPFYSDLEKEFKEVEAKLKEELASKLARWENILKNPNPDLKTIGEELKTATQKYPPDTKAKELLAQVWDALAKQTEPLLMKAKTMQELEGCLVSKPYFTAVQESAHFQEIPAWQEARRNLEGCSGDH